MLVALVHAVIGKDRQVIRMLFFFWIRLFTQVLTDPVAPVGCPGAGDVCWRGGGVAVGSFFGLNHLIPTPLPDIHLVTRVGPRGGIWCCRACCQSKRQC